MGLAFAIRRLIIATSARNEADELLPAHRATAAMQILIHTDNAVASLVVQTSFA